MMGKTHAIIGFFIGLVGVAVFAPNNQIAFMALAVFGALLPDIDHPKSLLGRWVKPIGWFMEHRGFFHSIWILIAWGLLALLVLPESYAFAIMLGFLSHMAADAFSVLGIRPLAPVLKWRIHWFMETGAVSEWIVFLIFLSASVVGVVRLGL